MQRDFLLGLVCCSALFSVAGCSNDGPELGDVSGVVTLDGKPVPGAIVTFHPQAEGSPSYGQTGAEGKYTLNFTRTKSGAMVGKHRVEITTKKTPASEIAEAKAEGQEVSDTPYVAIPEKYQEEDALTADVQSGDNEINFDLTSK